MQQEANVLDFSPRRCNVEWSEAFRRPGEEEHRNKSFSAKLIIDSDVVSQVRSAQVTEFNMHIQNNLL